MVVGFFAPKGRKKMSKLCVFRAPGHPTMYVNPMLVRAVVDWAPNQTVIEFDKEHKISLPLPIEQVRAALDTAMNAD